MAEPISPNQIVNTAEDPGLQSYDATLQTIPRLDGNSTIYVTEVVNNSVTKNTVNNYLLPDQVTANAISASTTPPANAVVGSIYYDTSSSLLLVWTGTAWTTIADNVSAATVSFTPTASLFSSNVQDVIPELQAQMLPLTGGTLTGALTLSGAPAAAFDAATKSYVDTVLASAQNQVFTPSGNITSVTIRGAINEVDSEKIAISGGTMTGALTLNADPTVALGAATKQYVDTLTTPAGTATQVLFVDNNFATGDAGFTYNKTTDNLTIANTLNAVNVATSGNVVASGNITAVNGSLSGNLAVSGNIAALNGSLIGNLAVTGNISGKNQTLSGNLAVTGNVSGNDFAATGNGIFSGNVQANVGFIGNSLSTLDGPMLITSTGINDIELSVGTGNINLTAQTYITNVKDPINAQDAATKNYVDAMITGLQIKDTCNVATTSDLATTSGGVVTYNNGSSGVGATLITTGSFATIDSYALAAGDRVLVKNETLTPYNGIYVYVSSSTLIRATDSDSPDELDKGSFVFITNGFVNAGSGFVLTADVTTVGTTSVVYSQFSSSTSYTAGTGLVLSGTTFNLQNTVVTAGSYGNATHTPSFTVDAQGRLTAASNVAITANAATLTDTTLNATVVNSSLTSVGTLTSMTTSGLANVGSLKVNGGAQFKFTDIGLVSGAVNIDTTLSKYFKLTATGVVTLSFSALTGATNLAGDFTLTVKNGGPSNIVWPASVIWEGGVAPTLSTTNTDVLQFITLDYGSNWLGIVLGQNYAV